MSGVTRCPDEFQREVEALRVRVAELEQTELEHRRTESALRESEARLRQLAETIDDAFWMTDSDHRILFASPAYERIWGRSLQSLYDNCRDWAEGIHPDDRQRAWETFLQLEEDGSYDEEYRVVRPDGSVRWVRD